MEILVLVIVLFIGIVIGAYAVSQIEEKISKKYDIKDKDRHDYHDDFYDFYE